MHLMSAGPFSNHQGTDLVIYTQKNMIFALIFADSHTQTLFKKVGSLFDLPDIVVSREAIMHHGSALFWQKKTRQIMMGRVVWSERDSLLKRLMPVTI